MKKAVSASGITAEAFIYTDKSSGLPFSALAGTLIAAAGAMGAEFTFLTCVDTGVSFFKTGILTFLFCAVFGAVMSLSEKYILPVLGVFFGAYAVSLAAMRKSFCAGLACVSNIYAAMVSEDYRDKPFIYIIDPETSARDTERFVILTAVFISLVFAYGIIYRSSLPAVMAVSAPLAEMCLYFGYSPAYLPFFALIASWFAVFALDLSMPEGSRAYRSASSQCGLAAALTALLCAGTAVLMIQLCGYTRPAKMDEINKEVSDYFQGGGFSRDIEEIRITEFIKRDSTINHGKLGDNGNITFSGDTVLTVTMPKTSDTVYLRGFTGSVYTGRSWEELPRSSLSELERINGDFQTEGLNTTLFGSYNIKLTNSAVPEYSFSVKNAGTKSDHLYMPYNLVPESVSRYTVKNDVYMSDGSDGWFGRIYDPSSVYGYRMLLNTAWVIPSASLNADHISYRSFVYSNYLDVPRNFAGADQVFTQRYYDFITAEQDGSGKSTLTDAVVFGRKLYYIKSWLRDNCEYSLKAGKLPLGRDFADYFLTETRKGSCSHFATAAVLLCRQAGIPARYIEGYVIKPGDFDEDASFGTVCTVNVTDSRAHAWAEVFIDGFGWYPIEFTSGYGNVITAVTTVTEAEETVPEEETEETTEETVTSVGKIDSERQENTDVYNVPRGEAAASSSPAVTTAPEGTEASDVTSAPLPDGYAPPETSGAPTVGFTVFGKHDGERRDIVYDLTGFIVAVLCVSVTVAAAGIRRVIIVRKCRGSLEYDSEKAARSIYRRFRKLARAAGVKDMPENGSYSEYIRTLENSAPCFKDGIAGKVINTALKAEFGGGSVTREEIKEMYRAVDDAVRIYESPFGRLKKFYLMYIIGIV